MKIAGGIAASAAGFRQTAVAAYERITKANVDQFHLKDIAAQKGKIITFGAGGTGLHFSNILQSIVRAEAHRLEDDVDFLWHRGHWQAGQFVEGNDNSGFRPSPNIQDISWGQVDYAVDFAQKNEAHNRSFLAIWRKGKARLVCNACLIG